MLNMYLKFMKKKCENKLLPDEVKKKTTYRNLHTPPLTRGIVIFKKCKNKQKMSIWGVIFKFQK